MADKREAPKANTSNEVAGAKAPKAAPAPAAGAARPKKAPSPTTVTTHYRGANAAPPLQGGSPQVRVDPIVSEAAQHLAFEGLFSMLTARSNAFNQSPVCYQEMNDGSWLVCLLQSDGSYGQCKAYSGPVHGPVCG